MTNRATNGSNLKNPKKTEKIHLFRVTDIIMDENHPRVVSGEFKWPSCMGLVICVGTSPINFGKEMTALPVNSNNRFFPVVNEYIEITRGTIPNSNGIQYFYDKPIALYGSTAPNGNFFPSTTQTANPLSQNLDYTQVESGAVNVVSNQPQQIQTNSPTNPSQATFVEKSDIHPLMPFEGDILFESRFGSSLRFGSTSKSKSKWTNNWSTSGDNGSSITILRNGQPKDTPPTPGYLPIVEDINKDLSSIYLTSTQKIPFNLSREEFPKWKTPPTTPSSFVNPQVIINSDRVIINSKNDSILISAKQSIGLSCNDEINFIGNNVVVDAQNIYLGSKNATEPILLGNKTVDALSRMLTQLIGICDLLSVSQIYPGGVPISDAPMNAMASNASSALQDIQNQLNSLKSNTSKTK